MRLRILFHEVSNCLVPSVRLVFSVFHPEMAAAGLEANFERSGVEYRLGAERHTVDDYVNVIEDAGLRVINCGEIRADQRLVEEIPSASKYFERPLLLTIKARNAGGEISGLMSLKE